MDYASMTTTELFAAISKLEASKREMVKALEQAADCIEDLGRGEGGWAWEEVVQEIDAVIERTK